MPQTSFLERLRHHERPVVVDIWAPWCVPCRTIEPALDRLAERYAGRVDLWRVNADEEPEVARALGVYGIPTLIGFRQGQEIVRRTGALSEDALAELFEVALSGQGLAHPHLMATDRTLRLLAGGALLVLGWLGGPSPALLVIGGIVLFSGVYDRCPLWRAIVPRLVTALRQER